MATGKIKWFSSQIGTGFIRSDTGENIFFRFSAILNTSSQTIRRGQCVSFDIAKNVNNSDSMVASKVMLLNTDHELNGIGNT